MPMLTHRPNFKTPWTDEQFKTLVDLLAAGQTIPEIAKTMGRSQEGVRAQAWKRGLLPGRAGTAKE